MMLMIESAPEGRAGYIGRSSISITLDIYSHVTIYSHVIETIQSHATERPEAAFGDHLVTAAEIDIGPKRNKRVISNFRKGGRVV